MTDLQFIELLKRAFFEFFFIRKNGKRPSVMNLLELVEMYKDQVIIDYLKTNKNQENEYNPNEKQAF